MTIKNGHFKTDGKNFEPCCYSCKNGIETNTIVTDEDAYALHCENGDCYVVRCAKYCMWCGAKLEYVNKLAGGQ